MANCRGKRFERQYVSKCSLAFFPVINSPSYFDLLRRGSLPGAWLSNRLEELKLSGAVGI